MASICVACLLAREEPQHLLIQQYISQYAQCHECHKMTCKSCLPHMRVIDDPRQTVWMCRECGKKPWCSICGTTCERPLPRCDAALCFYMGNPSYCEKHFKKCPTCAKMVCNMCFIDCALCEDDDLWSTHPGDCQITNQCCECYSVIE